VPLAGVLVLKRQWMLGKRYGFVTPREMLGEYYDSEFLRILVLIVALIFAVPFTGMQINAAGALLAYISNGALDRVSAMWLLSGIVFVYVGFGGLRAAAYVGALQALMLGAGIVAIGVIVYWQTGGFGAFNVAIGRLGASGASGPHPFEIPGVMVFNRGLGIETPARGIWTASMILSYCLALMGLQLAPHFSMLAFAARSPNGFVSQQTWASAAIMGAILVIFSVAQGLARISILEPIPAQSALAPSRWSLPRLACGRHGFLRCSAFARSPPCRVWPRFNCPPRVQWWCVISSWSVRSIRSAHPTTNGRFVLPTR
jgi:SSS family solute:Na+ symporter